MPKRRQTINRKTLIRGALLLGGTLVILTLGSLGLATFSVFNQSKTYLHSIKSGADATLLDAQSQKLAASSETLINRLHLPWVAPFATFTGVNFSEITPEVSAAIKSSPYLLGADKPRSFLVAFQNSAEARGTGGILGAFAIVKFDKGQMSVVKTGSNAILQSLEEIPIPMPTEYSTLYRSDPAIWQNSNISPHFPYGAQIWQALWKKQTGEQLDGVIAIDPTMISHVLNSTQSITMKNGVEINADNVVQLTLKDAYKTYETDNDARKQFLVDAMNSLFAQFTNKGFSKLSMAQGIKKSIVENRILIYLNVSKYEDFLAKTRLGGYLSEEPNNEYRVVIQNIDASKMDYYLAKEVSIACTKSGTTEVRVTTTNTVDATAAKDLPAYVLTRADKTAPKGLITGQHRFKVFIYGPVNSKVVSGARSNTAGSPGGVAEERLRKIVVFDTDLQPGQSENFTATFTNGTGKLTYSDQPLVIPTKTNISGGCS